MCSLKLALKVVPACPVDTGQKNLSRAVSSVMYTYYSNFITVHLINSYLLHYHPYNNNDAECVYARHYSPLLFISFCLYVVATCPDLDHSIENGNVSYSRDPTEQGFYVENTTATVSCDEGYRGGGNITCQRDGNWLSSSLPNCTSEHFAYLYQPTYTPLHLDFMFH